MLGSIITSMSFVIFMRAGGIGLQLIWFVILVRLLPLEAVGVYSIVNSFWILNRALGPTGYDMAFLREGGKYVSQNQYSHAKGLLKLGINNAIIINSIIYIIAAIGLYIWQDNIQFVSLSTLFFALIGSYAYLLFGLYSSALLALEKQVAAHALESLLLPFCIIVAAIILAFSETLTINSLLITQSIIAMITAISYFLLTKHYYGTTTNNPDASERNSYKKLAKRLFGTIAFNNLNLRFPVILSPFLIGVAGTALLEAALRFASLIGVIQWCASFVIAPKLSKVDKNQNLETLQKLLTIGCWLVFIPSLILFTIITFSGEILLDNIVGEQYITGYYAMIILSLGFLINSSSGPTTHFYMLLGHEKTALKISATETALSITLIIMLSQYYGLEGVATGMAFGLLFRNIYLNINLKKLLSLHSGVWSITGWKKALQIGLNRAQ